MLKSKSSTNMPDSAVSVQVALRIRPLVESEISRGCVKCLETTLNEPQVLIKDLAFTYNHVFPPEVSQAEFYETAVKSMVQGLFKGYNVTILAYGQTGSGKTHSMGTAYTGIEPSEEMGVIPRAVRDIFNQIRAFEDQYDFRIQVSFMELYQEQLFDLLSTRHRDQSIVDIREDNKGIVIPGLSEIRVVNASDTIECLIRGSQRRAVGATAMNSQSSRSHAIFTIHIQQQKLSDENSLTTCKFHLVDLAGSERANKTKATGNRFREGVKINEGLLALGNVISRLGDGSNGFIGYRDSKLTRLLQDSLGGNSLTLMIACVSPADYNLEETISTLRYADRARKIKNKPIINQDPKAAEINRLKMTVQQLRLELLGKGTRVENGTDDHNGEIIKLRKEAKEQKAQIRALTQALDESFIETASLNEKVILSECALDRTVQKIIELIAVYEETKRDIKKSDDGSTDADVMEKLGDKIKELEHDVKKSREEMQEHEINNKDSLSRVQSKSSHIPHDQDLDQNLVENLTDDDAEAKQEYHVQHQAALNTELQQLNKELASKQALAAQVARNYYDMAEYQVNIRENEDTIGRLQKERDELLQQIRNMQSSNTSTKLAEERRRRVQHLESEIADLQKKINQQAKLLKLKEKNDNRILVLNSEIQQMKASKVKLIRSMRAESESFRSWKMSRERELCKLRDQDRKRANEMAKMERMHGKQQNVLKRKVEEAVAINKRLKEALDRQKNAQTRRLLVGQAKADQVRSWVEQELEVLLSTVDAERTLEQLLEDRATIQRRLEALKLRTLSDNTADADVETDRKGLEEDLALRTAQIADFQEKIIASDQENKAHSRWDTVQSMVEAKCALRHLFEMAADMRRETESYKGRCKDIENKHSDTVLALQQCEETLQRLSEQNRERTAILECEHEEKVAVLLRQLRSTREKPRQQSASDIENTLQQRIEIQESALERMDELQSELDAYKEMCEELRKQLQSTSGENRSRDTANGSEIVIMASDNEKDCTPPVKKSKKYSQHVAVDPILIGTDSDDDFVDNSIRDPDYRSTPMYKRLQKTKLESKRIRASMAIKRNVNGETKCTCKGSCANRVCGCRKMHAKCTSACKCSDGHCTNRHDSQSIEQGQSSCDSVDSDSAYKKSR